MRWRDDNQFVTMDEHDSQAIVGDWEGYDSEVHRVVDDGFENAGVVGALDVYRDVGILLLEVGKNVRQDVEAGAFVGADDNFAAGNTFHLGDRYQHGLAGVERVFN